MTCDTCGDHTCGTGGYTGPKPGDPDNNLAIQASPAFGGIDVTWSFPGVNPHAVSHVQLYRAATNNFVDTSLIATVGGNFFYDRIDAVATYYYWIRVVSINGTVGEPIGPASATSRPLIGDLIEQLTGKIDAGLLAQNLKGKLDEISLLNANLAKEIFDRETGQLSFYDALQQVQAGVAEAHTFIANEIASRVGDREAIIEQINMIAATAEDLVAQTLVTSRAWVDAVDNKAGALWSARLTVNNLIGGFGIYNDGSEVQAGFDVDTFWVGRTQANKRKPFIIVGGETFIDQAVINQLTFTKLRDEFGSFVVENGKIKANLLDTNGLIVRDALGNPIFGAGYNLAVGRINGLSGFATLSKINAANIATYIESAAIGSAYIQNLAVKSAHIEELTVGTSKIAPSACTAAYSSSSSGASTSVMVTIPANSNACMITTTAGTTTTPVNTTGEFEGTYEANLTASITVDGNPFGAGQVVFTNPTPGTYNVAATRYSSTGILNGNVNILVTVYKR